MKWLAFLLCAIVAFACNCDSICKYYRQQEKEWYIANGKVKVLSTTAMIDDLVRQVGGDHVDTLVLIRGELDPHSYQLVKGDDEKFAYAQVIFYNGLGLEHGPSVQKQLADKKNAVPLGDQLMKDHPELVLHYNGQLDPHIWMDISLWLQTVPYIVDALSLKDPAHADDYHANGEKLMQTLKKEHQAIQERLLKVPSEKRYLVTSHDAFNYFTRAYLADETERKNNTWQKRFAAPEGLAPESQLSAKDIQTIIDHMREHKIHVLFPESNVSRDSIRKIVQAGKEYGLNLKIATVYLYGDAMGQPGSDGDSYIKMLRHNAEIISQYLNGEK